MATETDKEREARLIEERRNARELASIRDTLGRYVARSFSNSEDAIYGDYVKEYLCGTARKEADVVFRSKESFNAFHGRLRDNLGQSSTSITNMFESKEDNDFVYESYKVDYNPGESNACSMILRMKYAKRADVNLFPKEKRDIDIKQAKLTSNFSTTPQSIFPDLNIEDLKSNALRRMYEPLEGFDKKQEKSLTAEGWRKKSVSLTKKGNAMSTSSDNSFMNRFTANFENAAYSAAGTQAVKLAKTSILKLMETQGENSETIRNISDLLDTEGGDIVLSMMMGTLLQYVPGAIGQDERLNRLADKMVQNSIAGGANAVFGAVLEHVAPVFDNVFGGLDEKLKGLTPPVEASLPADQQVEEVIKETAARSA